MRLLKCLSFQVELVLVGLIATCSVAAANTGTAAASRVWFERGVATVTVGFDARTQQFTHRKFYAIAYGPHGLPGSAHDAARECTSKVTSTVGEALRVGLWDMKYPAPPGGFASLDEAARATAAAQRDTQVDGLMNQTIKSFRQELIACARGRFDTALFQLGLVQRVCDTRTNSCSNTTLAWADDPAAKAFNTLSLWVDARDGKHPTLPANALVLLPDLVDARSTLRRLEATGLNDGLAKCRKDVESANPGTRTRPLTCLALEMASRGFAESNVWPDSPPLQVSQAELERLVEKARGAKKHLDSGVPRIADVPREVAIRIVDVLDEPQQALLDLKVDAMAKLQVIQDEIARSRIVECARFRGLTDAAQVASCSGYAVDPAAIRQCLSGSTCTPTFGANGFASVLAQIQTGDRRSLAMAALGPRTSMQLQQMETVARECAKAGSHAAAASCALERQLGEREKRAWNCVRGKTNSQIDSRAVECAVGTALPAEASRAIECARQFKSTTDQARCALEANLPPLAAKLMECRRKHTSEASLAQCMAVAAGGDVGRAATCIKDSKGDWAASATCYASDKVPKAAADAMVCAQTSSDAASLGSCLALKNLPENLRKPAQCVAESGGSPLGTGVCMAGSGLNPDQRIAMECLATTSGEPVSFATCTGGRLFVKEMFNCVDKKLFEGNCMGEGNEIRKFLKALGINLTPNTVVGQALNVPLEVIKFQVAVAQSVLKGAEDLTKNISREVDRAAKDLGREMAKGVQNVGRESTRVVKQGQTDLNNGIEWAEGRLGVQLPKIKLF